MMNSWIQKCRAASRCIPATAFQLYLQGCPSVPSTFNYQNPPRENNYNCNPTHLVHLQLRLLYLKKCLKNQLHHSKSNNFIWRVAPYFVHSATHSALPEVKRPVQLLMVALIGWQNLHQQCLTERYTAQARQSARHRSSSPGYLGKASGIWSNDVTNKSQKCQYELLVVSKWQNNSIVATNIYLYRSIQFNDI